MYESANTLPFLTLCTMQMSNIVTYFLSLSPELSKWNCCFERERERGGGGAKECSLSWMCVVPILLRKERSLSWWCDVPILLCKEEREREGLTRNCGLALSCQSSSVRGLCLVNLHTEKKPDGFRSNRSSFTGRKTEVAHTRNHAHRLTYPNPHTNTSRVEH
jgi:hypothetical protein